MRSTTIVLAFLLALIWSAAAYAGGPIATPFESTQDLVQESFTPSKAFGDPTDFKASAIAAANYVRAMQADITEDNAGNGDPDDDLEDGGWNWVTTSLSHTAAASSLNLYGVTANGIYRVYGFDPDPALFTAMKDAADFMVAAGPEMVRSAADIVFLLNFASLPEVSNPSYYTDGARAIWARHMSVYGSATGLAEYIRDARGNGGWPNGIIPWDLAPYVEALMVMEGLFPGNGYGSDAADVVEVLYADAFLGTPGFFEPAGYNKGWDPAWAVPDFWFYPAGVAGLIRAFDAAGMYTGEIPALEALLHECQYDNGAFSYQYGAETSFDDRDWQTTAYAMWCLNDNLAPTAANLQAMVDGAVWLASTQDTSGGWVYSSGNHYPEIGGENAAAVAYTWLAAGASVTTAVDGPDPAQCSVTKTATFSYDRNDATPGLFGYEIVLDIAGPVTFTTDDFHDVYGMDFFYVVDQGAGVYSVNGALYGAVPGILADTDLFRLDMATGGDGDVMLDIVDYNLRTPDNTPFFADMSGAAFVVDCTAPAAVSNIAAAPHHNRVAVTWDHSGADVDHYVVFSGLWHDGAGNSVYPEYDDIVGNTIPTRPADYDAAWTSGEWDPLGPVAVTALDQVWLTAADRGVYYYEVFAVDAAGNISPPAAANDRATNYWLGDIDEDGFVDVLGDITPLGNAFGTSGGQVDYDEYCDVGRTDDWSRVGIPLTDSVINFEDLMVFSMNFSVVTDLNKGRTEPAATATLDWVMVEENLYALRLVDSRGLKGLHVRADLPVVSVESGDLLDEQGQPMFLKNLGSDLDLSLAVMGVDVGLQGTGDLCLVRTTAPVDVAALELDLRDLDNERVELKLGDSASAQTPQAFALHANYPNPFNPTTKISFSLPGTQAVELSIYAVDGRRIATLLNEVRGAGVHDVYWHGCDDAARPVASGTYFYRLDAGPYSEVRKMALMK